MRTFILFIRRFFNLILFIGLEVLCFLLISRTNTLQGNDVLSSANSVTGYLYNKQNDVVYYFALRQMSDSLINENARLRNALAVYKSVDSLKDSLVTRTLPHADSAKTIMYAHYIYHQARVINNSVENANNFLTLNRGSSSGVKKGMAVVSGTGAVGKIVYVSKNYSVVSSILNTSKYATSAHLKAGFTGNARWEQRNGPDVLIMDKVPPEIKVALGDSVITTSYSFFPEGIVIGTIYKGVIDKKSNERTLFLHPATNFRNMQYVYVVENTMADERKTLEDSTSAKPKPAATGRKR